MTDKVVNNAAAHRYELEIDGHVAVSEYRNGDGMVVFTHTEVPPALEGRGVASRLVVGALADVRARGLKVASRCEFVSGYLSRHPEYADILTEA